MFSFGNKDKEKLKENMEQIKEMVDKGDVPENSQQRSKEQLDEPQAGSSTTAEQSLEDDFEKQGFSENDNFDQGWEPAESSGQNQEASSDQQKDNSTGQSTQNFGDNQTAEQPDSGGQDKIERFEEAAEQTSSFDEPEPPQPQKNQPAANTQQSQNQKSPSQEESFDQKFGGQEQSSSNQSRSSTPSAPSNDNIPKPPETKEIEVPEIEKGPLFLKRQKFRKARQMVEEMRYLSDQIEGTLNGLEKGIQEDQNIEKDIRNMLHEFESSREEVQGIISPGEE